MTTRNISPEQHQWVETWIAGLRAGTYTSAGGFPNKAASRGIITAEEATQLTELNASPTVQASTIADVVENALFNGVSVVEARATRGM